MNFILVGQNMEESDIMKVKKITIKPYPANKMRCEICGAQSPYYVNKYTWLCRLCIKGIGLIFKTERSI